MKVIAEKVEENKGRIIYEWPTGIKSWSLKGVQELKKEYDLEARKVHGRTLGICAEGDTMKPIKKPWTIMTNLVELKTSLKERKRPGNHEHARCARNYTKDTRHYPKKMAHLIHQACEDFWLKRDRQRNDEDGLKIKVKDYPGTH